MHMIPRFAAAAVLAVTASAVSAADVDMGSIFGSQGFSSATFAAGAAINDNWTFTVLPGSFSGLVSSTFTGPLANAIQGFAATLSGPGGYLQNWGAIDVPGSFQLRFDAPMLAGGQYMLNVVGTAGATGSQYTLDVTAPVPEPHEWAMMLAGLGIVGWAARRGNAARGSVTGPAAAA